MHEGIDIGARSGTPIVSTADGVVSFAGKKPGFGNFIKIRHGYGVETIYAHAKKLFVKSGKIVKRGESNCGRWQYWLLHRTSCSLRDKGKSNTGRPTLLHFKLIQVSGEKMLDGLKKIFWNKHTRAIKKLNIEV